MVLEYKVEVYNPKKELWVEARSTRSEEIARSFFGLAKGRGVSARLNRNDNVIDSCIGRSLVNSFQWLFQASRIFTYQNNLQEAGTWLYLDDAGVMLGKVGDEEKFVAHNDKDHPYFWWMARISERSKFTKELPNQPTQMIDVRNPLWEQEVWLQQVSEM